MTSCPKCGRAIGGAIAEGGATLILDLEPVTVVRAAGLTDRELFAFRGYPHIGSLARPSPKHAGRVELFGGRMLPPEALPKQARVPGWRLHADVCPARPS